MANFKGPSKGGSGGKLGHSNMEHWTYSEELKESSKIQRRIDSRNLEREASEDFNNDSLCGECGSNFIPGASEYTSLCSECAHWIYGSPGCQHEFINNRCKKCGWDGSSSEYIEAIKNK